MTGNVARVEPALSLADWADAERLFRSRREAIVTVDQPLVLVSQVQRSGGTLVNTLLDGHPELHVHPHELHIGHPTKADWPVLDLGAGPDAWLDMLAEPRLDTLFATGYRKKPEKQVSDDSALPFTVVPSFVDALFRLLCRERAVDSSRGVIDRYMTAFFNAWIDNQGLREEPKKWVTGFAPRAAWGDSRHRFLADYPDGRIVACLREPRAWFGSASRFPNRYGGFDEAIELWRRGATEMASAKRESPENVFILTYEAVVVDPKRVMGALADWLGISWHPALTMPTFNRLPTAPNSSYDLSGTGVRTESLDAWRGVVSAKQVSALESDALPVYEDVRSLANVA